MFLLFVLYMMSLWEKIPYPSMDQVNGSQTVSITSEEILLPFVVQIKVYNIANNVTATPAKRKIFPLITHFYLPAAVGNYLHVMVKQ